MNKMRRRRSINFDTQWPAAASPRLRIPLDDCSLTRGKTTPESICRHLSKFASAPDLNQMIISHARSFIFIKTRKTAGTSVEVYLSQHCGPEDVITPIQPPV